MKSDKAINCVVSTDIDLPNEKYNLFGIEALSDKELLALIIRTGSFNSSVFDTVNVIMDHPCIKTYGLCGLLRMSRNDFLDINGIGSVKSLQLLSVIELSKRIRISSLLNQNIKFNNSRFIADYYMESMFALDREHVIAVFLDTKGVRLFEKTISIGTVNMSLLNPREVFKDAFSVNATSFFIVHNHPSGDPTPSKEDILITKQIEKCSGLLGFVFLDHIIIGDNRYISLREYGSL